MSAQNEPEGILNAPPVWTDIEQLKKEKASLVVAGQKMISCDRTNVINDYNNNFIGSAVSTVQLGWTGDVGTCDEGTISAFAQTNVFKRINYYRRLVGVPDNITYDPSRDLETQEASLMMSANNSLSHFPPMSWTCYTTEGATRCSKI